MSTVQDIPTGPVLPQIPGYRVLRQLGTGGMSRIYLGEQRSLGREVAIKVMLPEALTDEVSRKRFENEARTIARLEHPHIVGIHDVGRTADGLPYYSMPFLARGHLGQRMLPLEQARVRAILGALLPALAYAHARGVVHRDVKAENVLFDEAERPLLADFGIALRRGHGTRVTTAGLAIGSTAYMPPEQARGEEVDARADLYSLGVLTWEMLTGELPYNAADALSMAVMHTQDPIPRLPPALRHWQGFIDRALAKTPGKRFRDAGQMGEALARVPARTSRSAPAIADHVKRARTTLHRVPTFAWIGALVVAAAGVGFAMRDDGLPPSAGFYRAEGASGGGLPVPGALPNQPVVASHEDPMLRAAPVSAAERWITDAERQIAARQLTSPEGDNAYDSVLTAWQADRDHLRLPEVTDRLLGALGAEVGRRISAGSDARARELAARAATLAERSGRGSSAGMADYRSSVGKAASARLDALTTRFDQDGAQALALSAKGLGLEPSALQALARRAADIPQAGARVREGGMELVLVRSGSGLIAAAGGNVTRGQYAAFAGATGRAETLCRERASLLRIVARRTWQTPGFDQSASDPVVCVSWQDAAAYAEWAGRRAGKRYRLPTTAEARALPAAGGARQVAVWNTDCSGSCGNRVTSGRSWRGADGARPLEAARGYDDVGLRLVRDL